MDHYNHSKSKTNQNYNIESRYSNFSHHQIPSSTPNIILSNQQNSTNSNRNTFDSPQPNNGRFSFVTSLLSSFFPWPSANQFDLDSENDDTNNRTGFNNYNDHYSINSHGKQRSSQFSSQYSNNQQHYGSADFTNIGRFDDEFDINESELFEKSTQNSIDKIAGQNVLCFHGDVIASMPIRQLRQILRSLGLETNQYRSDLIHTLQQFVIENPIYASPQESQPSNFISARAGLQSQNSVFKYNVENNNKQINMNDQKNIYVEQKSKNLFDTTQTFGTKDNIFQQQIRQPPLFQKDSQFEQKINFESNIYQTNESKLELFSQKLKQQEQEQNNKRKTTVPIVRKDVINHISIDTEPIIKQKKRSFETDEEIQFNHQNKRQRFAQESQIQDDSSYSGFAIDSTETEKPSIPQTSSVVPPKALYEDKFLPSPHLSLIQENESTRFEQFKQSQASIKEDLNQFPTNDMIPKGLKKLAKRQEFGKQQRINLSTPAKRKINATLAQQILKSINSLGTPTEKERRKSVPNIDVLRATETNEPVSNFHNLYPKYDKTNSTLSQQHRIDSNISFTDNDNFHDLFMTNPKVAQMKSQAFNKNQLPSHQVNSDNRPYSSIRSSTGSSGQLPPRPPQKKNLDLKVKFVQHTTLNDDDDQNQMNISPAIVPNKNFGPVARSQRLEKVSMQEMQNNDYIESIGTNKPGQEKTSPSHKSMFTEPPPSPSRRYSPETDSTATNLDHNSTRTHKKPKGFMFSPPNPKLRRRSFSGTTGDLDHHEDQIQVSKPDSHQPKVVPKQDQQKNDLSQPNAQSNTVKGFDMSMFRKPGQWKCSGCLSWNEESDTKCPSCDTPNPSLGKSGQSNENKDDDSKKQASISTTGFVFSSGPSIGNKATTDQKPNSFMFSSKPDFSVKISPLQQFSSKSVPTTTTASTAPTTTTTTSTTSFSLKPANPVNFPPPPPSSSSSLSSSSPTIFSFLPSSNSSTSFAPSSVILSSFTSTPLSSSSSSTLPTFPLSTQNNTSILNTKPIGTSTVSQTISFPTQSFNSVSSSLLTKAPIAVKFTESILSSSNPLPLPIAKPTQSTENSLKITPFSNMVPQTNIPSNQNDINQDSKQKTATFNSTLFSNFPNNNASNNINNNNNNTNNINKQDNQSNQPQTIFSNDQSKLNIFNLIKPENDVKISAINAFGTNKLPSISTSNSVTGSTKPLFAFPPTQPSSSPTTTPSTSTILFGSSNSFQIKPIIPNSSSSSLSTTTTSNNLSQSPFTFGSLSKKSDDVPNLTTTTPSFGTFGTLGTLGSKQDNKSESKIDLNLKQTTSKPLFSFGSSSTSQILSTTTNPNSFSISVNNNFNSNSNTISTTASSTTTTTTSFDKDKSNLFSMTSSKNSLTPFTFPTTTKANTPFVFGAPSTSKS